MKIRKRLPALPLTALITLAHAQQTPPPTPADKAAAARANAEQNQQVEQQRNAQERNATVNAPSVRSTVERASGWPDLPAETPCFCIDSFVLDVPATLPDAVRSQGASALPLDRFAFAREWLDHYRVQCVGKAGLDTLTKGLQQVILSRGYITTRVLLPEHDLSTGTLKLALVPGVIGKVRFADPATRGTWKSAFPTRDRSVLNLRDLEQGLEQMKRVNSQDVSMQTDRHYFGASQFDGSLAYRQGVDGLGATPDFYENGPTYRFRMAVLDANLSVPFQIANQPLRYVTTVHGQFTNNTLNYIDDLTIGSRYTVRGFDGETMLAAERGFFWRNELQLPIGSTGQSVYAGIDYGRVFGPNTAFLAGTQLAGAVIGVRGSASAKVGALAYDLFAGTPIYKPSGFPTARVTLGFQLTGQF
ncbi:hemolysin activation/secretion protein [Paraburkholderia youngii]|uniref:ShlB/FhaC/HecB family hemolysin secretion/activation protein n=1 Tax=Paraburkholderia youngii TaxID=2782701 RepID=UPI003D2107AA